MAITTEAERREWWVSFLKARPGLQQFGQSDDERSHNGSTGCTDTILQILALGWLGIRYSHDQIRTLVGYTTTQYNERRGLNANQVQLFFDRVGLPYRVVFGRGYLELMQRSQAHGPVLFAECYGYHPEWRGYRYGTVYADGRPNGYASPNEKAGKTQLTGFERGAHAALICGYYRYARADGSLLRRTVVGREPNHGSVARPEKPPIEIITEAQFRKAYESYAFELGRSLYAAVPTSTFYGTSSTRYGAMATARGIVRPGEVGDVEIPDLSEEELEALAAPDGTEDDFVPQDEDAVEGEDTP